MINRTTARVLGSLAAAVALTACGARATPPSAVSAYVAMARGEVDVDGGLVHILAPRDGYIDAVRVREGQDVASGQELADLDSHRAATAVLQAQADLAAARAQLQLLTSQRQLATRLVARLEEARADDAATPQALDEATTAVVAGIANQRASEAQARAAAARLDEARRELDARLIRAPIAGRIVRRIAQPHMTISADSATELFLLLPSAPRFVRVQLDEEFAGEVRVGMSAEIVTNEKTGASLHGRVTHLGDVLRPREPSAASAEHADARILDCTVSIDDPLLRVGQRVLVRFLRTG